MDFTIDVEQETDGRWIAELREFPGLLAYGATREEAVAKVKAIAAEPASDLDGEL